MKKREEMRWNRSPKLAVSGFYKMSSTPFLITLCPYPRLICSGAGGGGEERSMDERGEGANEGEGGEGSVFCVCPLLCKEKRDE